MGAVRRYWIFFLSLLLSLIKRRQHGYQLMQEIGPTMRPWQNDVNALLAMSLPFQRRIAKLRTLKKSKILSHLFQGGAGQLYDNAVSGDSRTASKSFGSIPPF